jgi:Ribosomal protein L13e
LKKAGFEYKKAQKLGIAIDHRRRNTNEESLEMNVQRLKEYQAKLIVFLHKTRGTKGEKMVVDVWFLLHGSWFRNQMLTMFRIIGFLLLVYLLLHLRLLSVKLGMLRRRIVNMCDCARLGAMLVLFANGRRGLSRRLRKKLPRERKK